ncbi:MAG: MarR family transcriptional regulator [Bacteroidetes bacterium]|nr:MarR family transcriptional regulator [Bacteroidota bacterium]
MKLEDEIHQKSFKSARQKLAINIIYTSHWLTGHHSSFFKGKDITLQQYNVLRILRGQFPAPCTLKLIKERMLDRMSDTSRIIDKLLLKNYVERTSCPNDRRSVNLLITEKGMQLLKSLDFIDDTTGNIFSNLTESEIEQLNLLLDKLRD